MQLLKIKKDDSLKIKTQIKPFLNPLYVYIPIANNKLLVKQNEKVLKDQYLFKNNYEEKSPVSGIVYGISTLNKQKYIVIKNDFKEKREIITKKNVAKITISYLLDTLEYHHLTKLLKKFKNQKQFTNIVFSIVEDEPYSKNKIALFQEYISEILNLLDNLSIIYHSKTNTIVIKENEKNIIEDCINMIGTYPNIRLSLIKDLYLLSYEKYLLDYLKYEASETLILNCEEIILLYNALINNKVSTSKLVTISGDALKEEGQVFLVKKYTSAQELISKYFKIEEDNQVYLNGLLKGKPACLDKIIITDDVQVINIMKKKKIQSSNCFNCGKCINICPVGINVVAALKNGQSDKRCLNCGLCNYICPAYLDLKTKVLGERNDS